MQVRATRGVAIAFYESLLRSGMLGSGSHETGDGGGLATGGLFTLFMLRVV